MHILYIYFIYIAYVFKPLSVISGLIFTSRTQDVEAPWDFLYARYIIQYKRFLINNPVECGILPAVTAGFSLEIHDSPLTGCTSK
jgi:hypothetical protein